MPHPVSMKGNVPEGEETTMERSAVEAEEDTEEDELDNGETALAAFMANINASSRVTPSPFVVAGSSEASAAAAMQMGAANLDSTLQPAASANGEEEEQAQLERAAREEAKLLAERAKDWTQLELDEMFEQLTEHKFDNIPPFVMPDGFREGTQLFDFQQDGVRWLLCQETAKDRVAPFWKLIKLGMSNNEWWNCSLTMKKQKEMPVSPSSSILADGKCDFWLLTGR